MLKRMKKNTRTKSTESPFRPDFELICSGFHVLSNLTAHVVNRLLLEKRKTIPKFLNGKILFKNETLQILNFIPDVN